MRTLSRWQIIQWGTHNKRLVDGTKHVFDYDLDTNSFPKVLYRGLLEFYARITIIIKDKNDVIFHLSCLPPPPESCQVEFDVFQRTNVNVKSSEWTFRNRQIFETKKSVDSNEVILIDEAGKVHEGLSSNFFVIKGNTVFTAPLDSVLVGSIQTCVINICRRKSIKLVFEHPLISDRENWDGAFITSTSRLILPINNMLFDGKPFMIKTCEIKVYQELKENLMFELLNTSLSLKNE
ncbi:D-aminoacid aminotransferase-like PLP-dependent enzyme [Rozella allomycis CSF55]|uniref:D-aminoacid aminotransferase-like PLP-dependent enzyme n=1 Tax=Rozella allomycis (strain CSF55) TaxID=988480 RepID=A0A4P9YII6_ROZAC|nr:D-aminoacid aminotransferase-like PLP-dependent enzyme [Rozella allomycis CSF55]